MLLFVIISKDSKTCVNQEMRPLKSNLIRGSQNLFENKNNEVIFALVGNSSLLPEKNLSRTNLQLKHRNTAFNQTRSSVYNFDSYKNRFLNVKNPSLVNLPFQYKHEEDDATVEIDCSKSDVKIKLHKKNPTIFSNNKHTFKNKEDSRRYKIG